MSPQTNAAGGYDHAACRDRHRPDLQAWCATCGEPIVLIETGPHYVHQPELAGHLAAVEADREERYRQTLERMARRSQIANAIGDFEVCDTCGMIHAGGDWSFEPSLPWSGGLPPWIVRHLAADDQ